MKRTDEITLRFKGQVLGGASNGQPEVKPALTGLTFIHTATQKDAKQLLTRDFHADPNVCPHDKHFRANGLTCVFCSFRNRRMLRMLEIIKLDRYLNGTGLGVQLLIFRQMHPPVIVHSAAYLLHLTSNLTIVC